MKKKIVFLIILSCLATIFILLLNVKVTTRQGIDHVISTKEIPLYLKTTGYFYRHFAYNQLVNEIIKDAQTDKDKILAIFKWTHENIREVPDGFPIVDDHIWNIIIRGYGTCDQSADVFCMLCEYARIPAAWVFISPRKGRSSFFAISLVELNGKRRLFDTYFGNYFLNQNGEIATIDDLIANPDLINQAKRKPIFQGVEYKSYFTGLSRISEKDLWKRGKPQMPIYRLTDAVKKLFKR